MSGEMQIRAMAVADIDAVMAIADGLDTAPHWPRAAYEAALDPSAAQPRVALIAELSTQMIGFAVASLLPPQAELETIAVSASCQRRGVGRALLAEVLHELAFRGVGEVTLEVRASDVAAQKFYRVFSFVEVATRPAYYPPPQRRGPIAGDPGGDTGEAAILMQAHIASSRKRE